MATIQLPYLRPNKAFVYAVRHNKTAIVKRFLCSRTVDPTWCDNWPIRYASENGYDDIVSLLLSWKGKNGKFADPRVKENGPIPNIL